MHFRIVESSHFLYSIHILSENRDCYQNLKHTGASDFQSLVRFRIRIRYEHPLTGTYGETSNLGICQQKRDVDGVSTLFKCLTDRYRVAEGLQAARRNDHGHQFLYLVAS